MQRLFTFFVWLFFSLRGRIGRTHWWIGYLVLFGAGTLLFQFFEFLEASTLVWGISIIAGVAWYYPSYAVDSKRFHDRNKPGWFASAGPIVSGGVSVAEYAGWLQHDFAKWIAIAATGSILLWYLIELGCLRGTQGSNRHGSDPTTLSVIDIPPS